MAGENVSDDTAAAAASSEEDPRPRRLVLCLDGTWNNAECEDKHRQLGGHKIYLPTNVLKISRAVCPIAADGVSQIAYYSEGVGSLVGDRSRIGRVEVLADRVLGGALGGGFENRIKSGYRFLVGNYRPGDRIFIFGFSRGAAEAQALTRFIDWLGGILRKHDEYWIVELFEGFRDSHAAAGASQKLIEDIRARPRTHIDDPRRTEIELLGVFDTVLSLGYRFLADFRERDVPTVGPGYAFYVSKTPPAIVKKIRHALAIDENRWDFRPQVWQARAAGEPAQSLVQLWFPGVHSNVGGGYGNDGFADTALRWMVGEAEAAGLGMDATFLGHFNLGLADGRRRDEDTGATRFYERLRGKIGRGARWLDAGDSAGIGLHESAVMRLVEEPTYRPANLLEYLAQDGRRMDQVAAAQRPRVRAIVDELRAKTRGRQ
jgi:uncharacterized protein (DUF2235 family)